MLEPHILLLEIPADKLAELQHHTFRRSGNLVLGRFGLWVGAMFCCELLNNSGLLVFGCEQVHDFACNVSCQRRLQGQPSLILFILEGDSLHPAQNEGVNCNESDRIRQLILKCRATQAKRHLHKIQGGVQRVQPLCLFGVNEAFGRYHLGFLCCR